MTEFEYAEDVNMDTEIVFCWTDQEYLSFDLISHSILESETFDILWVIQIKGLTQSRTCVLAE